MIDNRQKIIGGRIRGFTLLELVVGIAILFILLLVGVWHWGSISREQALSKDRLTLMSLFEEARSLAVSSKSNSAYGINFSSTTAIVFQGNPYNGSNTVLNTYGLNNLVQISAVNLSGGGFNVYFERLTGNTGQSGSIKLSLINDANSSSTITILGSGIVQ